MARAQLIAGQRMHNDACKTNKTSSPNITCIFTHHN